MNSGTSKSSFNKLLMKRIKRVSSERMPAEVATTLMSTCNQGLVLTSVEKNLHLLKASRESPVDPD